MEHLTAPASLFAIALGYVLGSILFGLLLTKLTGLGDVRAIGSGNIGATNVLRTGNKTIAALTLLCDILKATAAVLLARCLASSLFGASEGVVETAGIAAGAAAFFGHLYPVWLRFKGGKGVATYLGMLLGAAPLAAAGFAIVWLATAAITRYSSLSALIAAAASPILAYAFAASPFCIVVLTIMSLILIAKHRQNIERLLSGKESKIGDKSG